MAVVRTVSLPHGEMTIIDMQSRPDLVLGRHVHTCPLCYEHVPCEQRCSVEPDLTLDDGTLRGAHCECSECSEGAR